MPKSDDPSRRLVIRFNPYSAVAASGEVVLWTALTFIEREKG